MRRRRRREERRRGRQIGTECGPAGDRPAAARLASRRHRRRHRQRHRPDGDWPHERIAEIIGNDTPLKTRWRQSLAQAVDMAANEKIRPAPVTTPCG